jgi:hypothetical protein
MENLFIEDSIKLKGKSKKIKGKIHQVYEDHKGCRGCRVCKGNNIF